MENSPSADLGGGSTHSSRDVRTTNPEMEVKRSSGSRAPTHNEYNELPASSNLTIFVNGTHVRTFIGAWIADVLNLKQQVRTYTMDQEL